MMKDEISRYGNRKAILNKNIGKLFELIYGQCTDSITTLLKGEDVFEDKRSKNDVIWLIEKLRQLTSGVDNEADAADVYFQSLYEWTHVRQNEYYRKRKQQ